MSFSISSIVSFLFLFLIKVTQPINEVTGVAIWCAVSFAIPAHNIFCSDIIEVL